MKRALTSLCVITISLIALGCTRTPPLATEPQARLEDREARLKQIILATRQRAIADPQFGRYPPDIEALVQQTDLTAAAFTLPGRDVPALADRQSEARWAQERGDYVYLAGGLTDAVNADIVLAHEKPSLLPPGSSIGVAYADGEVLFLPPGGFEKAIYRHRLFRTESTRRAEAK